MFLPSTSKKSEGSWVLRFYSPKTQKRAKITIGKYPALSIAAAAVKATELRSNIQNGIDPRTRETGECLAERDTFSEVFDQLLTARFRAGTWRKETDHVKQLIQRFKNYVLPSIGNKPIAEIKVATIVPVMEPLWNTFPSMAAHILTNIGQFLTWAEAMGYPTHNCTAAVRVALGSQTLKKAANERHQPALNWKDVPILVKDKLLANRESVTKELLLFLLLNAARLSAVRLMTWDEVDFESNIWAIRALSPGRKTKVNREYPLSRQSLEILNYRKSLSTGRTNLVFPSLQKKNTIRPATAQTAFGNLVKSFPSDIQGRLPVIHGLRTTFKGWSVVHGYDNRLSELQLCHAASNAVQQAYDRENLVEQRRKMMQDWADFCYSLNPELGMMKP